MEPKLLDFGAFLRIFAQNKNQLYSFLLGAGCSISSGVQSANKCIWDWKRLLYRSSNPKIQYVSIDSENDKREIQRWCNIQSGFPPNGDSSEYCFYVEKAYPEERDRRAYFEGLFRDKQPSIGYQLIALLSKFGCISAVWTTNFDELTLRAAEQQNITIYPIGIDNQENIFDALSRAGLKYISLHGDYKYSKLKNTSLELGTQEDTFVSSMVSHFSEKHLIVIGYSGRDKSLMAALKKVYSQSGGGRLFWLGMEEKPTPCVVDLLNTAVVTGRRDAYYIQAPGFDETIMQMSQMAFEDTELFQSFISEKVNIIPTLKSKPFHISGTSTVVKYAVSNMFPVATPSNCYAFKLKITQDISETEFIQERIRGKQIVTKRYKGQVYAFGAMSELYQAFNGSFSEAPAPITLSIQTFMDKPVLKNLVLKALLLGIARETGLGMSFNGLLWNENATYLGKTGVFEAIRLSLHFSPDKKYLLVSLTPTLYIKDVEKYGILVKQNLCRQYTDALRNKNYAFKINEWANIIFKNGSLRIYYSKKSKEFKFGISANAACGTIYGSEQKVSLPTDFNRNRLIFNGIRVPEPSLAFATQMGGYVYDVNPMRGLIQNRPFDLPSFALAPQDIKLSVICPRGYTSQLHTFLTQLNSGSVRPQYNDYTQPYEGFNACYGINLDIPFWGNKDRWIPCRDNQSDGANLANNICNAIDRFNDITPYSVVIIFIPNAWSNIKKFTIGKDEYDFHDYIKAFCAQKGVTTQFIEEKTLNSFMKCEVLWWLSLALFVKSGRTPWTLGALNQNSAYAGIGYCINKGETLSKKIIVGCSHIYNAHGQGLKFRLRKIENAVFDRKNNPYLTEDEAFKLGLNIVELFRESMYKFPNRVVIHKRTHFIEGEIKGLLRALSPHVADVALITIEEERDCKIIPGYFSNSFYADGYPIWRGVCYPINDCQALLWTHGSVDSVKPNKCFYQGGKGIPMPLRLTRCYGSSSLTEIASEILSFTKINWNTFSYYSKMPATIDTSNTVARIGSLLRHYNGNTFDYKYFI